MKQFIILMFLVFIPGVALAQPTNQKSSVVKRTSKSVPAPHAVVTGVTKKPTLDIEVRCSGSTDQVFMLSPKTAVFTGQYIKYIAGQFSVLEVNRTSEVWVKKEPNRNEDKELILALARLGSVEIHYQPYQLQMLFPPVSTETLVPDPEATLAVLRRFIPEKAIGVKRTDCGGDKVTAEKNAP